MKAEQETTEVIKDQRRILETILSVLASAKSFIDLSVSYVGPRTGEGVVGAIRDARRRGVRVRMTTEISKDNLEVMRAASRIMDVRHIAGLRGNSWAVTETEYVSSLSMDEFDPSVPIIYSNAKTLVAEHQSIFDALWYRGEPLGDRASALESGTELPEMDIIRDASQGKQLYLDLAKRAKRDVFIIFPTSSAFRRDDGIGVIKLLEGLASKGVRVRLLVPVDPMIQARLPPQNSVKGIAYRHILSAQSQETVTIMVVDGSASLTIDERDPSRERFEEAFGSALLLTSEARVRQNTRFFDRLWKETEFAEAERLAKESEAAHRKRAELMQDILTHDIRNFNQVARLNAELLEEESKDPDASRRLAAILRAVDGSTKLIERAKKLGSIMAAGPVKVRPINLKTSFERSVLLVRRSNPDVALKVKGKLSGQVLADGLLGEVFVNILANSVRYTDGNVVEVRAGQAPATLQGDAVGTRRPCWRVSISDKGKGIPDGEKAGAFKRYMEAAKGSGLGLSIVHALVTDRYGGRVELRDRVEGDYTKGTTVEVWLLKP